METPLIILDIETTGFKPENGDEILEIGAIKVIRDKILDEFVMLLKPMRPVDAESMSIHGITNELLAEEGKDAREVLEAFRGFAGNSILVGHNVQFDLGFLNHYLAAHGLPVFHNNTMDTLDIARRLLILPSYSLEKVAAYLKVPQPEAHRALADVKTTHGVLLKLFERAKV